MDTEEKIIDEKDLQLFMIVVMSSLGRMLTFSGGWTKTEMVK
jgi:hypothetical protein